jgi:hypothetical protein
MHSRSPSASQPFHTAAPAAVDDREARLSLLVLADTAPALPARGRSAF